MHVAELSPGSELSITVLAGNKKVVFVTKVVEVDLDSSTLVIEEIQNIDGKPLSFASPNISINMTSINENKLPIIWKNVVITHFSVKGRGYHRLAQTEDGKVENRRRNFRLYIGEDAVIQYGVNKELHKGILKDISSSGFGFVLNKDLELSHYTPVIITSEYDGQKMSLSGMVVRKEPIPDQPGSFVYGCQLNKQSKALDKFIADRQREQMRNKMR